MKSPLQNSKSGGFSLLEMILAMGVFAIAAVALASAMNLISVSVVDTADEAEVREQIRSLLVQSARDPDLRAVERETPMSSKGFFFRTKVERVDLETSKGDPLEGLFEVTVTAIQRQASGREVEIDTASTLANPGMF